MIDTKDINEVLKIQGNNGNWDYDAYMQGMYNGMELIVSMIEKREPIFRSKPDDGFISERKIDLSETTCKCDIQEV